MLFLFVFGLKPLAPRITRISKFVPRSSCSKLLEIEDVSSEEALVCTNDIVELVVESLVGDGMAPLTNVDLADVGRGADQ